MRAPARRRRKEEGRRCCCFSPSGARCHPCVRDAGWLALVQRNQSTLKINFFMGEKWILERSGSGRGGRLCLSPGTGLEPTVRYTAAARGEPPAGHGGPFTRSADAARSAGGRAAPAGREKITIDGGETTVQSKFCKLMFFKA